ncbi:peptidylprolyl isomerase [Sulfurospirillum sp. T05]|uniref:Peptidyl-prolyl cis-trans isomerase n=1 Tax=Sulfurospirillum tamanense TaxID=2813362 RepID=A0ABS2WUX3_9BACT|nr:peptidylprolyl isomerase [Sulfurospirillum tamanensis]MBN2965457.1 peptidylprolyl isomerase [Sulfurospirillum tamanensis]
MKELKEYTYSADELAKFQYATIQTNKGAMQVKLYPEETPTTVANFATLANDGFYDGLTFHRVIPNFVIQGGCPSGTGTGGPGWAIKCECNKNTHKHQRGTLSMAHAGENTGGSQFFVCHAPQAHLDGMHTVFGDVINEEGLKVLDSIRQGDVMEKVTISETL